MFTKHCRSHKLDPTIEFFKNAGILYHPDNTETDMIFIEENNNDDDGDNDDDSENDDDDDEDDNSDNDSQDSDDN